MGNPDIYESVFGDDIVVQTSEPFRIGYGEQHTITALVIPDTGKVTFEIVGMTQPTPGDPCCNEVPAKVSNVATSILLQYNGIPVVVDKQNPVLVLDAPQGHHIRAKYIPGKEEYGGEGVNIIRTVTRSSNVSSYLKRNPTSYPEKAQ